MLRIIRHDFPRAESGATLDIRFLFAYTLSMFQGPSARKTFVVACKKCRRDVPTGAAEFPFQSIVVECPLCGEGGVICRRRYFLGVSISPSITRNAREQSDV